jgi:hypothetical protein
VFARLTSSDSHAPLWVLVPPSSQRRIRP